MKYKTMKLFLISLIFILVFLSFFKRLENINFVNSQMNALGDTVVVQMDYGNANNGSKKDFYLGLSNKQIEEIRKNENVVSMILGENIGTLAGDAVNADYYNVFNNPNISKLLNYKYGGQITKSDGVVISEDRALDVIDLLKKDISVSDLIGQKIDFAGESYIIEGIYKDKLLNAGYNITGYIINNKELLEKNLSKKGDRKYNVDDYNYQQFYNSSPDEQKKYIFNVVNKNTGEIVRKGNYEEKNETDEGELVVVDYEASVENGVTGLIDPNTSEYPAESVNNMVIKVKEGTDKKEFTNFINEQTNNAYRVISSETKYGDVFYTYPFVYVIQLIGLVILVVMFVMEIKKKK